jgi:predicted O-methyltransferase YrrM
MVAYSDELKDTVNRIPMARSTFLAFRSVKSFIKNNLKKIPFLIRHGRGFDSRYYDQNLIDSVGSEKAQCEISDHLGPLFFFSVDASPRLMVELGTRGGDSTRSLLSAAKVASSTLLSVDINDCEAIKLSDRSNWHFIKADDVEFGRTGFKEWCIEHSLDPEIDLLFIDTSHEYEHTKQEIETWAKHLAPTGTMIFHDTNMGTGIYARTDGSLGAAWNNHRGVIRAIEEFVGRKYDESSYFCDLTAEFNILHYPSCCGLTVMKKRKTSH